MHQARLNLELPKGANDANLEAATRLAKTKSLLEQLRHARMQYAKAAKAGDCEARNRADQKVNRLRLEWRFFQVSTKASRSGIPTHRPS
jgi:hypothetical protein